MRAPWFTKAGCKGTFYRCGACRTDHAESSATGIYVMVGNELLAIVCSGCTKDARETVSKALPWSFPDLDDKGQLL